MSLAPGKRGWLPTALIVALLGALTWLSGQTVGGLRQVLSELRVQNRALADLGRQLQSLGAGDPGSLELAGLSRKVDEAEAYMLTEDSNPYYTEWALKTATDRLSELDRSGRGSEGDRRLLRKRIRDITKTLCSRTPESQRPVVCTSDR